VVVIRNLQPNPVSGETIKGPQRHQRTDEDRSRKRGSRKGETLLFAEGVERLGEDVTAGAIQTQQCSSRSLKQISVNCGRFIEQPRTSRQVSLWR